MSSSVVSDSSSGVGRDADSGAGSSCSASGGVGMSSSQTSASTGGGLTMVDGSSVNSQFSKQEQEQLVEKESRMIYRSKILFVLLLLVMTAVAAALTYYFSSQEETKTFESEFKGYAHEIKELTDNNAKGVYNALHGFGITVTSFALYGNVAWPNLTLPHFPHRGNALLEASGADHVLLSPIVTTSANEKWESFAASNHQWIDCMIDSLPIEEMNSRVAMRIRSDKPREEILAVHSWISESTGIPLEEIEDIYQVPAWQMYPMEEDDLSKVNFDLLSHPSFHRLFHWIKISNEPVLSEVIDVPVLFGQPSDEKNDGSGVRKGENRPRSILIQPVFKALSGCRGVGCMEGSSEKSDGDTALTSEIGALAMAVLPWDTYLSNLLPKGVDGIYVVLRNTCGDVFTYRIDGPNANFLGPGDHHETEYDNMMITGVFDPFGWNQQSSDRKGFNRYNNNTANCNYFFDVFPSHELKQEYYTNKPGLLTFAVTVVFALTALAFVAYDCLVQRRQEKVMDSALRSNAIVSSLFPAEVRDRLFAKGGMIKRRKGRRKDKARKGGLLLSLAEAPKFRLNHFLAEDEKRGNFSNDEDVDMINAREKPIADLFPNATVLFADIAGFTAWSSIREPSQVFTLLETLYRAFDHIAKRRRVFKVETIGDSYVAVTGLPEPQDDHAIVMARFSRDCLKKMNALTTELEEVLGPGTGELTMRFGLNSGPVTAGVLRGEKSRFQLFGDTVNTAARMESTGTNNRIQISEETARLLSLAGKEHWYEPRAELVNAKGKGKLQTFWLHSKEGSIKSSVEMGAPRRQSDLSNLGHDAGNTSEIIGEMHKDTSSIEKENAKIHRMVGWIVDILAQLLRQIISARKAKKLIGDNQGDDEAVSILEEKIRKGDLTVHEEVSEFVSLPEFDKTLAEQMEDASSIELKPEVIEQLRLYVKEAATMYRSNPFHNFEHAGHVTSSISKLLSRIVAADVAPGEKDFGQGHILAKLHERTSGITSDPLTQFAVVFSGLIHDVDHRGVPNFVLVKEEPELAGMYKARSIAEQNSVDLAWERLMEPDFKDLRRCIYHTANELSRFRQTVVNTIMATDIFDRQFAEKRKDRWNKCFHDSSTKTNLDTDNVHRRATIVIEHLIQASDVAHTMQHWQIYQKWNSRLFNEMMLAYRSGRLDKDPSQTWYESELGFFDNYIIPLAKKLRECGVFGVSSDEYLNYALENRREWSARGQDILADWVAKLQRAPEA